MNIKNTLLIIVIAFCNIATSQTNLSKEKIVDQQITYTNKIPSKLKSFNTAPNKGIIKNIIVNNTDKPILAGWVNTDGKLSFPEATAGNPAGCVVESKSTRVGHSMFGHVHVFADRKTNIIGFWISDKDIDTRTFRVIIDTKK